jgi:uncharacterized protein (TIGR02246 family)
MRSTCRLVILPICLLLLLAPLSWAHPQAKPDDPASAAIQQVLTDFYQSFSRHDAHGTAMNFAEDADFTNMYGAQRHGRKEIEDRFTALFAGVLKSAQRTDTLRHIRFLTPDLASVDADTLITGSATADGSALPPRKGLLIAVMTRQNGRWLITVFHEAEFPAAPASAPAAKSAN